MVSCTWTERSHCVSLRISRRRSKSSVLERKYDWSGSFFFAFVFEVQYSLLTQRGVWTWNNRKKKTHGSGSTRLMLREARLPRGEHGQPSFLVWLPERTQRPFLSFWTLKAMRKGQKLSWRFSKETFNRTLLSPTRGRVQWWLWRWRSTTQVKS